MDAHFSKKIIDGKLIAKSILETLAQQIAKHKPLQPGLAFIRAGNDPASIFYVDRKQKVAAEIGVKSYVHLFEETVSETRLLETIEACNKDPAVHGILVQTPLPKHLNQQRILNSVHVEKDVDGFNTLNLGKLCQEDPSGFIPCTPAGILELLKASNIATEGAHVVILGRSLIVGKPLALLLSQKKSSANATVTLCHSKSKNLEAILRSADIIVAAIGKAGFVKRHMIKENAVVIDVGITRVSDPGQPNGYTIAGDVDFKDVIEQVSKITPVPGGVGPMTIAMLMKNTFKAFEHQLPFSA